MTSSSDTFPFGIADVVELLGLTVRRRLPSSMYLNCPFCGDQRGRLNVNTDKNVWRCNRCCAAGGMLALYARYNCTSNADAYRAGLGQGVGKALDRLAQYYIKLAENTFPVIEVDAGRQIDVVITKGVRIDVPMTAVADRGSRRVLSPETRYLEATDDGNY